jgi:hypothetical protein
VDDLSCGTWWTGEWKLTKFPVRRDIFYGTRYSEQQRDQDVPALRLCVNEKPDHVSLQEYGQLEVGWSVLGIQVWCKRHDVNVLHMDFEGNKHPANQTCIKRKRVN